MKLYYFSFLMLFLCSCNEVTKTNSKQDDYSPVIYRNDSIIIFPTSKEMIGELNSQLMFYIETNGNKPLYYIDSINDVLYTIHFGSAIVSYDLKTKERKNHHLIRSNKYDRNYKISKYKDLIIFQSSSSIDVFTRQLKLLGSLLDSVDYKVPFCNNRISDCRYKIENDTFLTTVLYYDKNHEKYDSVKYSFVVDTNKVKLLTMIKNCP